MAKMFPDIPCPFEKASKEGLMFDELKKISDEYYVFHSVNFDYFGKRNPDENKETLHQHQADFIIFHPKKGILVLEAKAGEVIYRDRKWYQKNRKTLEYKQISPYEQAKNIKYDIYKAFDNNNIASLKNKCKFQHAVWFIDSTKDEILSQASSTDINIKRTLTYNSIEHLEEEIKRIFELPIEIELENKALKTELNEEEVKKILDRIFIPSIDFSASEKTKINLEEKILDLLTNEQKNILNYLDEQNIATISGTAGTGKTFIALESARRHSKNNENVLFLCYNKRLRDYLENTYSSSFDMVNVSFYTIDSLAYDWCNSLDYSALYETICDKASNFPYQHIIIDEAQDFGRKSEDENIGYDKSICDIIELFCDIVNEDKEQKKTLYLFYDKSQLVNCRQLPDYLLNADCKLTLYINCRNTDSISKTSSAFLKLKKRTTKNNLLGQKPKLYNIAFNADKQLEYIDSVIKNCIEEKIFDIQILTCKTIEKSVLYNSSKLKKVDCDTYKYIYNKYEFDFTTCRKYKGLEAQAVILIDVVKDTFKYQTQQAVFYVGCSRAKNRLFIFSSIDKEGFKEIAQTLDIPLIKGRKPISILSFLDVDIIKDE